MEIVYLGLGSNVGNRLENLTHAITQIEKIPQTTITKKSNIYETEPVGVETQENFFNTTIEIKTELSVEQLYQHLKTIEKNLGRKHRERWGPREIDIDILLFGNHTIETELITVPHKELHKRQFVLTPLQEIAKDCIHPIFQKTITTLQQECNDIHAVKIIQK